MPFYPLFLFRTAVIFLRLLSQRSRLLSHDWLVAQEDSQRLDSLGVVQIDVNIIAEGGNMSEKTSLKTTAFINNLEKSI